ncbi:MAG TPA: protein kinase [Solirubrobacteraceae bacterium]|nr:protein kinase [Solirubrobacteraceae bacterium]
MTTPEQRIAGRYRLERRLGVGGMSTVHLAFDQRLERAVAIKLLAEHLADDPSFVSRFRREALAAARLVHPNIVQVFDFGFDEPSGRHFIVMEYVPGRSCAEILRDEGPMPNDQVVDVAVQACRGLDHAHRHGVVHRDVKPGNLMVSPDGIVKLADFGIAKAAEQSSITQVGSVLGTAAYLAPEQARGEEAGPAADLYALGVVTYQLMSGRLPYEATSLTELAFKQQNESPTPLDSLVPEVSPPLAAAVAGALALDPSQRYHSAPEMAGALGEGLHGVFPERAAATAATSLMAGEDETAATRMLPSDGPRTEAPVRPRQPRAPRPPVDPAPVPARERAPAADQRDRDRRQAKQRGRRRLIAWLLVLALVIGAIVVVIVLADQSNTVKRTPVNGKDVNSLVDQLHTLVDNNTR